MEKLFNLINKKSILDNQIKKEKKLLHKKFVKENKKLLLFLDLGLIFVIIINLSSVVITNSLVIKEEPTALVMETNIKQATLQEYKPHPESKKIFNTILIQLFIWSFIIFLYIQLRRTLYTDWGIGILIFLIILWSFSMTYDFSNNLGYFIGRILYGG